MDDDIAISFDEPRSRYVARRAGAEIGIVLVARPSADRMVINHVEVVPALGGRGLAEKLVAKVVEDARAAGLRLLPRCSYAALLFRRRREEWQDVIAGARV